MPHAIIDWGRMRLPTTRRTPLTGDVKTVAVPTLGTVMQIVSFQMMNRCYTPHRSALRRGHESVDCDMPDRLNADLSTPSRPLVAAADGSPLLTDDMLVDHDVRNPLMSLPSGDCPVPLDQPPTQKRGPKTKKKQQWYKNGHTGDQRRDFEGQGWQSRGPHPSDSSL